jgi:hypothetical protein
MAITAMIKQIKELRKIDQQPAKSEFKLSDQWQEVPEDAIMPPGVEYRMDLAGEKTYARLIKENCNIQNNSNVDVSQLENMISHFYPYVKEKLKFNKDATVRLVTDPENAKNAWGKTAQYNPNTMEITIFVDGRHPKDMLRSISHELVHHAQNCRGEFDKTQALEQGYAQKDPHMRRMEGEAYLLGNGFLVRDFEDYLKSQQNQNLTENKKMKGLTNEQLKAVLENTIKRVMEEGSEEGSPPPLQSPTDQGRKQGENPTGDENKELGMEESIVEEEVVEETEELNESFTSKKDQLLFERLTNKWAK